MKKILRHDSADSYLEIKVYAAKVREFEGDLVVIKPKKRKNYAF